MFVAVQVDAHEALAVGSTVFKDRSLIATQAKVERIHEAGDVVVRLEDCAPYLYGRGTQLRIAARYVVARRAA